ncbi:MAG TPA: hypothetical protein VFQ25_02420 [Ktedonobacterales bacterium]|nr:hypothetical protein [Ktedonobacterales bacterium]
MPSDTPRPRASHTRPRPSRPSEPRLAGSHGQPRGALTPTTLDPRGSATLGYALPLVPALYLLARERRNRFVRLHAAQALVFFACVALAQTLLFALVIFFGNVAVGTTAELPVSLALWGALIALGVGALVLWLRLLADAWHGRLRRRPILSPLASELERLTADLARAASNARRARRNSPHSSDVDATPTTPSQPS